MFKKYSLLLILLASATIGNLYAQPELKHSLQGYYYSDEQPHEYEEEFDDYDGYYYPSYDDIDDFAPGHFHGACNTCPKNPAKQLVNNDPSSPYGEYPRYVDYFPPYYYNYPIYHGHRYGSYFGISWGY